MPIAMTVRRWFEPRLRSGPVGMRLVFAALLAVGGFVYVLFGLLVFDAVYWLLGKIVRVQADRRVRIGASLALAVMYLVAMEYIGLNESPSTHPGATPTAAVAVATTSPAASAAALSTPTVAVTSAPTATPAPTRSPRASATATSSPTSKPIVVTGDSQTGASSSFKLAAGTYKVAWSATADVAGCAFSLILSTKPNGNVVKSTVAILPEAKGYAGQDQWNDVPAGTYVLYEDQTGLLDCRGLWSATLTS